jgi:predicted ABC-class ATPase
MVLDQYKLDSLLRRLDGKSYKAYREIKGSYKFPLHTLFIDHIQADPYAPPSRLRIKVSHSVAKFSPRLYNSPSRKIALEDYLTRKFAQFAHEIGINRGSGNSGLILMATMGQEVLLRNSVLIDTEGIEIRLLVGFPARGRTIMGYQAVAVLCEDIPELVERSLLFENLEAEKIEKQIRVVEDADYLREQLSSKKLVAFIPNGAILPRRSGIDARALISEPIPFQSPSSLEIEFDCPNLGKVQGMGIPEGITLIVGGGYHGKSTLLKAIELGIYNHIPGDGRELVVTNSTGVKIRAEDGRSIVGNDISPFINHLPQGKSTTNFSSTNASGSTSQAANILEALEMGSKLLLIDEDTAATNFMLRDRRMQQLITKEKEPITPFLDKVKPLYDDYGISTILVMGGSGDYFEVADTIIAMDTFQPYDVTHKAKAIAQELGIQRTSEGGNQFGRITARIPLGKSIDPSRGKKAVKFKVIDVDEVIFGKEDIDLDRVEQIVDSSQLRGIALAIVYAKRNYINDERSLREIIDLVMRDIDAKGLDILTDFIQGDLALFRGFELAAALNRLRTLQVNLSQQ